MNQVSAAPEAPLSLERPSGLAAWVTTTDHKRIGLLYIGTALVFFLVAVAFAMLMRTQLMTPNEGVLSPSAYNQIFSMHGTTMVFLFAMPILSGFANYLVPLMIGARDMAFPRLNALSYWVFLFGGLLLYASFVFGGGALDTGWFSYAPLTERAYSPHDGVTFWVLAIILLGMSSILGSVNFLVTMLKLRAPGMTFRRMPVFAIATFVNAILILFAIPSLTAAVAMLYLDRMYGTVFFDPARGGNALIWQHLFWFFGHPEVYILILPAFGMMSEVVPVFSRKPLFGRSAMIVMIGVIGFLGFSVWAHHMFAVGLPNSFNAVMAGASMLIAIPTGVKIFNWLATMWGGSLRFGPPLLFASGFIALFTIGGLTGVTVAVVPFDWQVTDTYYIVAHLHNVLFAGTLFAVFAGIYYWFPKITGRLLDERLGKLNFWLILVGFMTTFMPMYVLGLLGMPRRVYTYASGMGWETLNLISTLGGYVIAVAVTVFVVNVVMSLRRGRPAGDNPWNAWTLEWATSSPPPAHNFTSLPPILSERPLWDRDHAEAGVTAEAAAAAVGAAAATARAVGAAAGVSWTGAAAGPGAGAAAAAPGTPDEPPAATDSVMPVLCALAMLGMGVGLLGVPLVAVLSGLFLLGTLVVWVRSPWQGPALPALPGERFPAINAAMLTFIGSEAVFFGSLIYALIHLRLHAMEWPPAGFEPLAVLFPTINTVVLLASGVCAHYALAAFRRQATGAFRWLLVLTVVLGAAFLGGQAYEYATAGFGLSNGLMGSTFFTLTGFHGAHVTAGLFLLLYMYYRFRRERQLGAPSAAPSAGTAGLMAAGTYYWHFVDAVWVVVFFVVYLL